MSKTYSTMNYISSFGFSERWRRQFLSDINLSDADVVVDLMTGMGECWKFILRNTSPKTQLVGLDFSEGMIGKTNTLKQKYTTRDIRTIKENVFGNSLRDNSADCVVSAFGLKTFNEKQIEMLAKEIHRILKPNGMFSLVEISVPNAWLFRKVYMFYLRFIIPVLGKMFLGNPDNYRMLGFYTTNFKNARLTADIFSRCNFEVEYLNYFYGCASGIKGKKVG